MNVRLGTERDKLELILDALLTPLPTPKHTLKTKNWQTLVVLVVVCGGMAEGSLREKGMKLFGELFDLSKETVETLFYHTPPTLPLVSHWPLPPLTPPSPTHSPPLSLSEEVGRVVGEIEKDEVRFPLHTNIDFNRIGLALVNCVIRTLHHLSPPSSPLHSPFFSPELSANPNKETSCSDTSLQSDSLALQLLANQLFEFFDPPLPSLSPLNRSTLKVRQRATIILHIFPFLAAKQKEDVLQPWTKVYGHPCSRL
ncbi:hypothetical protein BLNAU_5372 [Blattamonas nauphoetae]|uniref:Uncharacterized protein n=1 Tax=Blattamonas nauphoetae TaxID=2049346 RepID=A0ABQ9Y7E3_9EUKA|nr:hypothetical protein BLNAU_5372 [Blattamonas nauphoetae]